MRDPRRGGDGGGQPGAAVRGSTAAVVPMADTGVPRGGQKKARMAVTNQVCTSLPWSVRTATRRLREGNVRVKAMWRSESLLRHTQPPGDTLTILVTICDDHPAFALGLAKLLADDAPDIEVVGVADGAEEAERLAREVLPDVMLMDIMLPGIDGIEATRRVRSASPGTKVVILTASDEVHDLQRAMRAGASGYVVKDQDVTEIADAVRAIARGNLVLPSHLAASLLHDLESAAPDLNDAEREILAGIARGETNKDLATRLHLSERTVRRRVEDIYSKLHLADRIGAAIYASKRGLGATTTQPQRSQQDSTGR